MFLLGMCATDFEDSLAPEARLYPEMPWFGSSVKKQADYILKNMGTVCNATGTDLKNVVWAKNFYTDLQDFYPSLEIWQQYFLEDPQASFVGAVKTPHLIPDCTILFDAVAVVTV